MFFSIVFTLLPITAAYFLISRPLSKRGAAESLEIGLATIFILSSIIYWGLAVIAPAILQDEKENQPCGQQTYEARCYSLTQEACLSAWKHYEEQCWTEARANQAGPTQLLGSGVKKCTRRLFDKYMSYNRKTDEESACSEYFQSLKE
jgi:hypothetical protein